MSIEGRLTGDKYIEILEEILVPLYLIQDNSPIHSSKKVKQWFDNQPYFILINWPANSPDLNPIENLWAMCNNNNIVKRTRENLVKNTLINWEKLRSRHD